MLLKDGHVAVLSQDDGHVNATYDGSQGLLGSAHTLVADLQHHRYKQAAAHLHRHPVVGVGLGGGLSLTKCGLSLTKYGLSDAVVVLCVVVGWPSWMRAWW